jgi:hypothetical protein
MLDYEKVKRRFSTAKSRKQLWEHHLRECYRYAIPERNTIDKWSPGTMKRDSVFDDTAVDALQDFASRLTSQLVPNNTQWMKLESGTDIPKEEQNKVNSFLEETTDILFNHLNSSNFTSQVNEAFLDLGISTGAIICEEGDGIQSSLNFRAISLSELILEYSSRGIVETVFREFRIPVKDVRNSWKNAKFTESMKQMLIDKPTTEISLIEAVVEENNKYTSVLMYPREKAFLVHTDLDYNPYVIFRENTIPGEVYGRGRIMRQLNNIKTLNRMVEDYLKGLSFQANPIFTASDDGIINPYTVKLRPGSILPVGSNDNANPTLRALQLSGNPQLMDFAIRNYQDQIRRALLSKPFGSIEETPVRSATEMSMRNSEQAASTLSASSRVQSELLERIVANSIQILKKAGKVSEFSVNGREVKIKFVNPATRQQDESTLAAYGRFMEFMAVFPPEIVAQKIKVEDIPVGIYDTLGLPMSGKRDEEEIEEMQAAQAQQQAAQQGIPQEGVENV